MSQFQKESIVKLGGSINILRAEYISAKKGFDKEKYQKALENYVQIISTMGVLPLDDFYRIGIEHLHELSEKHREMLIKLKKDSDALELNAIPAKIKQVTDIIKQFAAGFAEIEKEYPNLVGFDENNDPNKGATNQKNI